MGMQNTSSDTQDKPLSTDPQDLRADIEALKAAQALQAATFAGAEATQTATFAGSQATQAAVTAGAQATQAAATAGLMATVAAGFVALVVGLFLGSNMRQR